MSVYPYNRRRTLTQIGKRISEAEHAGHTYPGKLIASPYVLIHTWASQKLYCAFLLGESGSKVTQQGSEWEAIDRPRRKPVTEWKSQKLLKMEIDAMFDQFGLNLGLEQNLAILEELAERPPSAGDPTVKIWGAVPHTERRWVIEDLSWGNALRNQATGKRIRQQVQITLMEHVEPEKIIRKLPVKTRWYKIAKADTQTGGGVKRIAQKTLGKQSRWTEIVKLNKKMRGPNLTPKDFPVGKQIRVPTK